MRVNTQDARFDARRVGRWSGLETFNVTRDRLVAYARATNDDIREHATGELASPAFPFVIAFELFSRELAKLVPPAALTTGVHGGQSFWYHRPIEPGMTLLSRAE